MKTITTQRRWQLKQVALGKCSICNKKLFKSELCKKHHQIAREKSSEWHKNNREKHLSAMKERRDRIKLTK